MTSQVDIDVGNGIVLRAGQRLIPFLMENEGKFYTIGARSIVAIHSAEDASQVPPSAAVVAYASALKCFIRQLPIRKNVTDVGCPDNMNVHIQTLGDEEVGRVTFYIGYNTSNVEVARISAAQIMQSLEHSFAGEIPNIDVSFPPAVVSIEEMPVRRFATSRRQDNVVDTPIIPLVMRKVAPAAPAVAPAVPAATSTFMPAAPAVAPAAPAATSTFMPAVPQPPSISTFMPAAKPAADVPAAPPVWGAVKPVTAAPTAPPTAPAAEWSAPVSATPTVSAAGWGVPASRAPTAPPAAGWGVPPGAPASTTPAAPPAAGWGVPASTTPASAIWGPTIAASSTAKTWGSAGAVSAASPTPAPVTAPAAPAAPAPATPTAAWPAMPAKVTAATPTPAVVAPAAVAAPVEGLRRGDGDLGRNSPPRRVHQTMPGPRIVFHEAGSPGALAVQKEMDARAGVRIVPPAAAVPAAVAEPALPPVAVSAATFAKYEDLPWDTSSVKPHPERAERLLTRNDSAITMAITDKVMERTLRAAGSGHIMPVRPLSVAELDLISKEHRTVAKWTPPVIVQGVDAIQLASSKYAHDSVQMVASQYNFLEAPSDTVVAPRNYIDDRTQGPFSSIVLMDSLIRRHLSFSERDPQKLFAKYPQYRNGYLELSDFSEPELNELLATLTGDQLGRLLVCVQSGYSIYDTVLTQVFCAAPSFQGRGMPQSDSTSDQISRALLVAQYKAAAIVAVEKHRRLGTPVNLHLTLVGGGVFNNTPEAIAAGVQTAIDYASARGVRVMIHCYAASDEGQLRSVRGFDSFEKMTKSAFMDEK